MKPGWHEVRESGPLAGGSLLAALVAQKYEHVIWVLSSQAHVNIFNLLDWAPEYIFAIERIDRFFLMLAEVHDVADLVVVDNFAELAPVHPQNVHIAGDVKRHWFRPKCPVIVLNQERVPHPPGGEFWRSRLQTKQTLSNLEHYPDLYSQLCPDGRWLVWERSRCIRCGCLVQEDNLLACPQCNLAPWVGKDPYFGAWDYQQRERVPCKGQMRDWPFLGGKDNKCLQSK